MNIERIPASFDDQIPSRMEDGRAESQKGGGHIFMIACKPPRRVCSDDQSSQPDSAANRFTWTTRSG
jgi:hypothetical protein